MIKMTCQCFLCQQDHGEVFPNDSSQGSDCNIGYMKDDLIMAGYGSCYDGDEFKVFDPELLNLFLTNPGRRLCDKCLRTQRKAKTIRLYRRSDC